MNKRPYFYKDATGKIQKYTYCSLCLKGPFTKEQFNIEIFSFRNSIHYCLECARINFREKVNEILNLSPKKLEQTLEKKSIETVIANNKTDDSEITTVNELINEIQIGNLETVVANDKIDDPEIVIDEELINEMIDIVGDSIGEKEDEILDRIDKEIKVKKVPELKPEIQQKSDFIREDDSIIKNPIMRIEEIEKLTAKQIIAKVKELTREEITLDLKNKKGIIKKAFNTFVDHKISHL
jgi:hypothetical protein